MRRPLLVTVLALTTGAVAVPAAWARSPQFINNAFTITRTETSLTVAGKEAGLGGEAHVHVVLNATALCINPGGHHPKATNRKSFSAEGDYPVQTARPSRMRAPTAANFNATVNVKTGEAIIWSPSTSGGSFKDDPAHPALVMVAPATFRIRQKPSGPCKALYVCLRMGFRGQPSVRMACSLIRAVLCA
jgi:hypothetical protein